MYRCFSLALLFLLPGCDDETGPIGSRDSQAVLDAGGRDHSRTQPDGNLVLPFDDMAASVDAPGADGDSSHDLRPPDARSQDVQIQPDVSPKPDLLAPDTLPPGPDLPSNPTGLTVPCKQGPGWTLFRFHYGGSSKNPKVDVWDASCSYSFAPGSACNVYAVYPGFGSVSYTSQGYPILTTSHYLRVRFSVAGLSFKKATVHVQARSYATSSSTYYRVWSPLYGGLVAGPVDNDWVYDWYGLDWSQHLDPGDKPSLTAIQIYGDKGSGKLAVKAVELCVQ